MDGTLSTYKIAGPHSMKVNKEYQLIVGGTWATRSRLSGVDSANRDRHRRPVPTLTPEPSTATGSVAGIGDRFPERRLSAPIQ